MNLENLLQKQHGTAESWFDTIADKLLNHCILNAKGRKYRLGEIEFYYLCDSHPDVFTHNDPLQKTYGQWYFHRTKGTYREGSFKGLDITFGEEGISGGVLIRTIAPVSGDIIVGPSLSVDDLLKNTQNSKIADLDNEIQSRKVWDTSSPLHILEETLEQQPVYTSPRVGLSLKRAYLVKKMSPFIMKSYRYLIFPKDIKKGRPHVALSLYTDNKSVEEIHEITKIPKKSVEKYIDSFEAGKQLEDFQEYIGANLNPEKFSRLYGTWSAIYSS